MSGLTIATLVLGACGGGDDSASSTTTTSLALSPATSTTAPPTIAPSTTTTTTTIPLVTEGAKLIVANASGINGAAGRMSDALAAVGFSTGPATNSTESQLSTSKVYFDPENAAAEAVANSVRAALGGGDIQVLELTTPAPVETGEVGDASIVLAMGNDVADKSLAELQGLVPPATEVTTPATSEPSG